MKHEVLYRPTYSILKVTLDAGESIRAEAGAMVSMSENIRVETSASGGLLKAFARKLLAGESFFMNTFTAEGGPGEALFSPPYQGDIIHVELRGEHWYVQGSSYLASSPQLDIGVTFMGAKGLLSREGLFFLDISGVGSLFISSFGAIHPIDIYPGRRYVVDTGHLVAISSGVNYRVKTIGGLKSLLLSGEGLVTELEGTGKALIQTRSVSAFALWLYPFLPKESGG